MDKPEKLILSNGESYFSLGRNGVLVGIGVMVLTGGIALTQTDATLADLLLPMAALSTFWLFWVAINIIIGLIHKFSAKRDINRLFEKEIWQHWQFRSDEWQGIVEAKYQTMYPKGGAGAYIGAVYSTIVGLVISTIMVGVGKYVIKDEQVMPTIFICAGAVLLLLVGAGLFQPIQERNNARKYRRKALRVREPRVWFGAEGVYHEAFGYTSLKELKDVNDRTKTLKTIKFTVKVSLPHSIHYQPVSFLVPSGYKQQAARLVRRYRQERLRD